MVHDPPPIFFDSVFSDPKTAAAIPPLLTDPRVRAMNWPYRPWRKVRPIARQEGLDPTNTWAALKLLRWSGWRKLHLSQADARPFGVCVQSAMLETLHRLDHALGGGGPEALMSPDGLLSDPEMRKRFIVRTLMDEAIDSSRIEGAVTTRAQALDLLRGGGAPKNKSERMIVNNYQGMQWVKSRLDRPLSPEMLLELQTILTRDTLDDPGAAGRLRTDHDQVRVVDSRTSEVVYTPPGAERLRERLVALCEFANAHHTGDEFLHPIVKACVLHFMVGYEHPFVDGNGRTARAVFYWSALRAGYRVFEHLVISTLILKAFAAYPQAFIDVEDDEGDLTYFVAYKLNVIERAVEAFKEHVSREQVQVREALLLVQRAKDVNLRQRLLLEHALRHPKADYTARSHATANAITIMTARTDLERLRKKRLFATYRTGKEVHYVPAPDLEKRLKPA